MDVLFLMPNWATASELFMQRMLEALEPHLAAIVAHHPREQLWRGHVPALCLNEAPALWRRAARCARLPARIHTRDQALACIRKAVRSPAVSVVFAHYL